MAEVEMEKTRPNIRIEIQNNLSNTEQMEVDADENLKSDNEEGEIVDDNETMQDNFDPPAQGTNRIWTNQKGIFTTGINIFDKAEQGKLQERARRFALKPDEIHNFTDADLEELYKSLGIVPENKANVRFDGVHILGTNDFTAEDILEYFVKYAPTTVEWVSEDSCNVTWVEEISAARAMFYISKAVQGMPARDLTNPFVREFMDDLDDQEEAGTGQSILLKNKNRIVELQEEKEVFKNAVDISEITVPIPPGYWRLGEKHPKAKCLLLRFAFKTDKKPYQIESLSKYYKNFGASKGIIPDNRKRELRGIFDRNREMNDDKNPWGSLAKNWHRDAKFCEKEPEIIDLEKPVEIKNPSIRVRLGTRKQNTDEDKQDDVESSEEKQSEIEKKKAKIPRMRMYADEEEEKIRRKKMLQTLKKQADKLSKEDDFNNRDLRNVLGITNKKTVQRVVASPEPADLGTRLKNRTKNMVFTVEREAITPDARDKKENVQSDIRKLIEERRARSPIYSRRKSPLRSSERETVDHRRSNRLRRSRSPIRRPTSRSPRRKRRQEGTLHSDRIENERRIRRRRHGVRNSHYSDDEVTSHKPRSKVAVVIKTQKKPAVASTIWSRVSRPVSESGSDSESGSESSSESESSVSEEEESSSSASESESEEETSSSGTSARKVSRPGFGNATRKMEKIDFRNPLKITMTNDHFKK